MLGSTNCNILFRRRNIVLKAYKFRIYPTLEQEQMFLQANGLCRLYWNVALAKKQEEYEKGNNWKIGSAKSVFEECKPEALEWMKEIDSTILAAEWSTLTNAFNNFFNSCSGKRRGKLVNPPKFKSKKTSKVSFSFTSQNTPSFRKGKLFLTRKIGLLDGKFHRFVEGKLRHATISQTPTGKWFVSICVEKKAVPKNNNGKAIGIDWNCRDDCFLTLSNGTKVKCPRFLKEKEKQLARYQRKLSKKFKKGAEVQSSNYYKTKYRVAKLHEKVSWQRQDWLHKLSYDLAQKYQYVVTEDVNLQSMSQMHHGKAVGDQGFGMLRTMIAYKTTLVKVSAKNTSKACHICGYVNPKIILGVETWKCPVCGESHDRDINAAKNILKKGVASLGIVGRERTESTNACGGPCSSTKQEVFFSSPNYNKE